VAYFELLCWHLPGGTRSSDGLCNDSRSLCGGLGKVQGCFGRNLHFACAEECIRFTLYGVCCLRSN